MAKSEETAVARLRKKFENHPVWSVVIFVVIVLIGVNQAIEPLEKLAKLFDTETETGVFIECRFALM